jgi:hypothetical protein
MFDAACETMDRERDTIYRFALLVMVNLRLGLSYSVCTRH